MARPKVIFTTIFDPDEPLDAITGAVEELDDFDVAITGDHSRLERTARQKLLSAPHVELTGWLDQSRYLALMNCAEIVVSLTSDPYSVMRTAFEASWLERVTVLSDTATLRAYFSPSIFVENSPAGIAAGVRRAAAQYELWSAQVGARHDVLVRRWEAQRGALESAMLGGKQTTGR